jgi:Rieske Fe-S protein
MAEQLTRRTTITGAAGLALGLPVLAACGGGSSRADEAGGSSGAPKGPVVLGPTSDVAVGGGKVYGDANVVVTQPEAGTFKAFEATCTHQGCQVAEVADGTIDCTCHGSRFSIQDGSVEAGPARSPLPELAVTVTGGRISVA